MDEPHAELKVGVDDSQTAPDFESLTTPEELVSGGRTRYLVGTQIARMENI